MNSILLPTMLLLAAVFLVACDRSSDLKGQKNTTLTFYGLVVDQDGTPLPETQVQYQVEAYPKDWTFDTRGRPYDVSTVTATSDSQGRFSFRITGCHLRMLSVTRNGYRHLWEQDTSDNHPSTYGYQLIAWSDLWYKSDPEHPAVYVFVKDGVHEVSALPCKGGYWAHGKQWVLNKPDWPKKPSLMDVVQKQPTTKP